MKPTEERFPWTLRIPGPLSPEMKHLIRLHKRYWRRMALRIERELFRDPPEKDSSGSKREKP